jgi:DNA-binding CsgD family transcriptional regulator
VTLHEIADRLRAARRKSEVVATLMDTVPAFVGADGTGVYEFGRGGKLTLDSAGVSSAAVHRYLDCMSSGCFADPLLNTALERSEAVADQSVSDDAAWRPLFNETARPFGYRHLAIAPVIIFDGSAAISCLRSAGARAFSERELLRLMSVSLWSSSALTRLQHSDAPDLTARQREVVELVLRGLTNREIAALLQISANTVKKHLKDIFFRHGISRRAELATLFR